MGTDTTAHNDEMIKGLLYDQSINVTAIDGREMVEKARTVHDLWPVCTAALGRTLLMTAMLSSQLKHEDDALTTIIKGGGPAGTIVVAGRLSGLVKGYLNNPHVDLPLTARGKLDVGGAVGRNGTITVVKDMGLKEPYVGQSQLQSGEIAEDFAHFFLTSDGQPTLVYLGVLVNPDGSARAAGGLWLQPLPHCDDKLLVSLQERAQELGFLTRMLDAGHTLGDALLKLLGGSFEQTGTLRPRFLCDCSRSRLERVIISMGESEIEEIIDSGTGAELTCHFCNEKYFFSTDELRSLLALAK